MYTFFLCEYSSWHCIMFAGSQPGSLFFFFFSTVFCLVFFLKIRSHGTASDLLLVGVRDYTPHFYT